MIKYISQFVVAMVLWCAAMFGAWLGGADPGWWTLALGAFFSVLIIAGVAIHESTSKEKKP